jgi:hypothetical protein
MAAGGTVRDGRGTRATPGQVTTQAKKRTFFAELYTLNDTNRLIP